MVEEKLIRALLRRGLTEEEIAAKFGFTAEEAKLKIEASKIEPPKNSGIDEMAQQFTILCQQYDLLGESLKRVALVLGQPMSVSELSRICGDTGLACKIMTEAIVLKPCHLPLEEIPRDEIQGN